MHALVIADIVAAILCIIIATREVAVAFDPWNHRVRVGRLRWAACFLSIALILVLLALTAPRT
jgi:hypothetical protein